MTTEWDELSSVLSADSVTYLDVRNSYLAARPKLIHAAASRALHLHGGQLPASWTHDDLRLDAAIALINLINALRLYGTELTTGWGRLQLTPDQLVELIDNRDHPQIDPRVLQPEQVERYLVRWAAPIARQAMEDAEDDEIGRRRGHRLRKALAELSQLRGASVTAVEAAEWANRHNAETYGIAEATRNPSALAIARADDLDHTDAVVREANAARIRRMVSSTHPAAATDTRVVVTINREAVKAHGLRVAALSGSLVRPTDLIDNPSGPAAREAESAALRDRLLAWLRSHPSGDHHEAAAGYTTATVTELGHRRLRAAGNHLTVRDLQPTHPRLVDPDNPSTTVFFGSSDPMSALDAALFRDEILAHVAVRHSDAVVQLASEWLECSRFGLQVCQTRQAAHKYGFADRTTLVAAMNNVSSVARLVATRYLGAEPASRGA